MSLYPPESTPFARIARTIRPRLSSYCNIDSAFVLPVANDDYDVTIAEPFFIYFQFLNIEAFGDTGGGRLNPWAYRRLRVYIYTRSGVDTYGTDEVALQGQEASPEPTDSPPPIGQFGAEELVLGALFNWMPLGDDGKALCTEPLHPMNQGGPPYRKAENSEGLLRSAIDFQCRYGLYVTKADPPS